MKNTSGTQPPLRSVPVLWLPAPDLMVLHFLKYLGLLMSCLSLPNFLPAISQIHIHCASAAVLETVVLRGTKGGELLCSFPWGWVL